MKRDVREKLKAEIRDWTRRGLLDADTADGLAERCEVEGAFLSGLLRWLGLLGILTVGLGLLGLLSISLESPGPTAALLLLAGMAAIAAGGRLSIHPSGRKGYTASAVLTVGILLFFGALVLGAAVVGVELTSHRLGLVSIVTGLVGGGVGYVYARRWPLLLGLLFVFHGLGALHHYAGSGTYVLHFQNPKLLAAGGLLAVVAGLLHEDVWESSRRSRFVGFGHHYLVIGLAYFNVSLWILAFPARGTVFSRGPTYADVGWVILFGAVAVAEIVLGSIRDDARFLGFGIVFLAINAYTRYYEYFWDRFSLGVFFFLGGLSLLVFGAYFESQHRARRQGLEGDPS